MHDIAVPKHGRNWPEPDFIDERLGFLARASALHHLVELNEIDVDQAFDDLVTPFLEIVFPRPENSAETYWDSTRWREAAAEYHHNRLGEQR
jgi:hypothetical protein